MGELAGANRNTGKAHLMPDHSSIRGRPRRRATDWVRANHPPSCALCGYPIDMNADRQRHPLASAVDEWHPRKHGGSALDLDNLRHLHRYCNGVKGSRQVTPQMVAKCQAHIAGLLGTASITRRTW